MPRRRSPLRLHHGDTMLLIAAVLTAALLGWLALSLGENRERAAVAFTVELPGVDLSPTAAGDVLRRATRRSPPLVVTAVSTGGGTSFGIAPVAEDRAEHLAAERVAERVAEQIASDLRTNAWRSAEQAAAGRLA
ncbi:MAG: hypothetical protein AAF596_06125, partial [Planctomycetota bacterium]